MPDHTRSRIWLYTSDRRYPSAFQSHSDFLKQACDFQVVVFATFPEFHEDIMQRLRDKACSGQRFVFTVHNAGNLMRTGIVKPGMCSAVALGRIQLLFNTLLQCSDKQTFYIQAIPVHRPSSKSATAMCLLLHHTQRSPAKVR